MSDFGAAVLLDEGRSGALLVLVSGFLGSDL